MWCHFVAAGLAAHVECEAGPIELLGSALGEDDRVWRPTRKWLSRVSVGVADLLQPGRRVTGQDVECIVGHVSSLFLIRRELLGCLSAVYQFVRHSYTKRQPL